jgi:hypothetical protein
MRSSNSLASAEFGGYYGDYVSEELAAAWEAEPRCTECGEPVRSALEAALLVGSNRVAHRERCFIPALVRRHPHLRLLAVRKGAQEGHTTRSVPVSDAMDRVPDTTRGAPTPEPGDG